MYETIYDLGLPAIDAIGLVLINGKGQLAGHSQDRPQLAGPQSFASFTAWAAAVYPAFLVLPSGTREISLEGISEAGAVCGTAYHDNDPTPQDGVIIDAAGYTFLNKVLGTAESSTWDINSSGQVIGLAGDLSKGYLNNKSIFAFVYDRPANKVLNLTSKLAAKKAALVIPRAINEAGQVAVLLFVDKKRQTVIYDNGKLTDVSGGESREPIDLNDNGQVLMMGDLPVVCSLRGEPPRTVPVVGYPRAMNNSGVVVGVREAGPAKSASLTAWRWSEDRGAEDLDTLIDPAEGWRLMHADDVNDDGVIVGVGSHKGQGRLFQMGGEPRVAPRARQVLEQLILYGVIQDGPGKALPAGGRGPVPVDPWQGVLADTLESAAGRLEPELAEQARALATRLRL